MIRLPQYRTMMIFGIAIVLTSLAEIIYFLVWVVMLYGWWPYGKGASHAG